MRIFSIGRVTLCSLSILPGMAQAQVKIGFMSTLSGPEAVTGVEIKNGFDLAVAEKGGKLGGVETTIIVEDDQAKTDVGRQLVSKLLESDHVDIVTGTVFSNVLLAIAPPVFDSGAFLLSANPGPSDLAGRRCNPNFFSVSYQNDMTDEAVGQYYTEKGYKRVYLVAPNYPAGRDHLAGFKRFYKGNVVADKFIPLGTMDFAGELASMRQAAPDALYTFFPGGMAINFLKQFEQSGLDSSLQVGGYGFTDVSVLSGAGKAAATALSGNTWAPDIDNAANKTFVAAYQARYKRLPGAIAEAGYDVGQLIDGALRMTGGSASDRDKFRAAMATAPFKSPRGDFKFNRNHFPIENLYLTKAAQDASGNWVSAVVGTVFTAHGDAYVAECKMP